MSQSTTGSSVHAAPVATPPALPGILAYLAVARPTKRMRWALTAYAAGEMAIRHGKEWWQKQESKRTYTLALGEDDEVYPLLHRWLLEMIPDDERRSLVVRSRRGGVNDSDGLLDLYYDGSKSQSVRIGQHDVKVQVERDSASIDTGDGAPFRFGMGKARVVFTASSIEAKDAVLGFLHEVAKTNDRAKPRLWIATRWGDWSQRSELLGRSLDTVVLKAGQLEELVDDLTWFLAAEADYLRMGLPWHRGYLFHGPPGTGKTSLARALASHFDLDMHYVPLSDLAEDTQLLNMFAGISARSFLLLEDIDVVHGAKERTDETTRKQLSTSGLLNALDGVATPHGLITVMTTNDLGVLDPALIRPGRADKLLQLGYLDAAQLVRLCRVMLGRELRLPIDASRIDRMDLAPAEVVEALGPTGSRDDAEERLAALLWDRRS